MGAYINFIDDKQMHASALSKISVLMESNAIPLLDSNMQPIQSPAEFQENMVCVVDNGYMAACGYAYSESEFKAFLPRPNDQRPRYWFIFDRAKEFAEPKYWENEDS
jgi:hypothetical protein